MNETVGPKKFKDKNGVIIKLGDILIRHFVTKRKKHPGRKRVAYSDMGDMHCVVPDEGGYLPPEKNWIKYKVGWDGWCMALKLIEKSSENASRGDTFTEYGEELVRGTFNITHYMDACFNARAYEVWK